jgi:hypothetical protein
MIIRVLLPKESSILCRGYFKGQQQDYISNSALYWDVQLPPGAVLEMYPNLTKLEECPERDLVQSLPGS